MQYISVQVKTITNLVEAKQVAKKFEANILIAINIIPITLGRRKRNRSHALQYFVKKRMRNRMICFDTPLKYETIMIRNNTRRV